jgi:hypothetical protein
MTAALGPCFRGGLLALVLGWQSFPAAADDLADFHAAVDLAAYEYQAALQTLDTRSREETAAAVSRFRQSWQVITDRFAGHRPEAFADDETLAGTFMQVDARIVGALIVIDIGNREAARSALAPIAETLAGLSARSAPAPH